MINSYLEQQIKANFPYQPTKEQENAAKSLSVFLQNRSKDKAFVLKGFAGTGKTSLIGALVKTLNNLKQKVVLMAPTGMAAKVFSSYAEYPAFTIHKKIYRQKIFSGEMDNFTIADNLFKQTLFIVDEASLIANGGLSSGTFGSGRLLDDLIQYVYAGEGCSLLLIGDTAQLPPVGEVESPALMQSVLQGYGLEVMEASMTQVVRQEKQSGILFNATQLRQIIEEEVGGNVFKVHFFADVKRVGGADLIDELSYCYDRDGLEETMVVCRSNKRANLYNKGIRAQILYREDELNTGDILMVAKNNYYWTEDMKELDFLANGELAVVRRIRKSQTFYGYRFVDVTLNLLDHEDLDVDVKLLLDTLHVDSPALPVSASAQLFNAVMEDYADEPVKVERLKKIKKDPYYNAVQIKYAYAITCHKAQGGQWKNIFLDRGYGPLEGEEREYYRWLYTAFTRATQCLYLVNWPE